MELPASVLSSVALLTSLFVFIFCLKTADCFSQFGNETDRLALSEFKSKISNDPYGILSSWNHSISFCKWHGVTCGRKHQRVTSLNLQGLSLTGAISLSIGNLTFLGFLNLADNELHGQIPQEIGSLFRLRHVNLSNNALEGEIPNTISNCSKLENLVLFNNHLVGKIPLELGSLNKLIRLWLFNNNLTGEIPYSLGNFSSLQVFSIGANKLRGQIPQELGKLKSLTFFSISVNNLTGIFPPSIFNSSFMEILSVSSNQLKGNLPPNIGLTLPNLQEFYLGLNQFHGTIPISLANASQLQVFDINSNSFTGEIPTNFGNLNNLQKLNLGLNFLGNNNNLSHDFSFVESLSNCSNLETLNLFSNNFGGVLPITIANISSLLYLGLGSNQISGKIPAEIGNLPNLVGLGMEKNFFSGSIPISLGKIQKLQLLYLNNNKLSGKIPESLGNLSQLYSLALSINRLEGNIPSSIGNCRNLKFLQLWTNNLTGPIPQQIIGMPSLSSLLDLSVNSLTGSIPSEVGKLKNIWGLDLSENRLSGTIPPTISGCQSLEMLDFHGNFLRGVVPSSLASLKGLEYLDLSRNNLSGKFPKELEKLVFLQYLNVSFNNLSGEVPKEGVFSNVSEISLVGNTNLCGGNPKLQLPVCVYPLKQKIHRSPVIIILATTISSIAILAAVAFFCRFYRRRTRKSTPFVPFLKDSLPRISYNELLRATGEFSLDNLIGQGSFGTVYRGKLDQKEENLVAIKVFNLHQHKASKSFIAECKVLRNIRHRNLVKVLTYCSSIDFKGNDFKALVFDFMANGSLETWLHPGGNNGNDQSRSLNLLRRLEIAIDVASALHYVHDNCETPIIHCDLKPSNILLDDDMTAHVGDFGLARLCTEIANTSSQGQTSSIGIKGTIGYMAPEYGVGNAATTSGDTYSFGIILLEMFTGKRPTDEAFANGLNLHNFVKTKIPEEVTQILDQLLLRTGDTRTTASNREDNDREDIRECNSTFENSRAERGNMQKCIVSVLEIGVACSTELPEDRMNMRDALRKLNVIKDVFLDASTYRDQRRRN